MTAIKRLSMTLMIVSVLVGCASLPEKIEHPIEPMVVHPSSELSTWVAKSQILSSQPEMSAMLVLDTGWNALAQRLALVESAQHSIDIQYYIWNSDDSGRYLASRLVAAADRGVRVRVMLDDINLNERESLLLALDNHPQIEIRVFNPIPARSGVKKWVNLLSDFSRLNRRMHNKSFTVDGVASIVGGRNIGDEYFDLSHEINFRDRDALVLGQVVPDIEMSFTHYWNSEWSYAIQLLTDTPPIDLQALNNSPVPTYKNYPELPVDHESAVSLLSAAQADFFIAPASFIYDRPVPVDVDDTNQPKVVAKKLFELAVQAEQEILIESAYLIFDDHQLHDLQNITNHGVHIKALTNSMASNDLVTNHSGYAGRREEMLVAGVELFELKPEAKLCELSTQDVTKCAPDVAYGLHAKSAVFDRKIATIGSFNFNLRSTYLNTESLLIIEDSALAERLATDIQQAMQDENSWYLALQDGEVRWYSGAESWKSEPDTGQWQRIKSWLLQRLPIEKYL